MDELIDEEFIPKKDLEPEEELPSDDSTTADESQGSNALEMLMDFNPCASMPSAVFKVRTCAYCGNGCNKVCDLT